MGKSFPTWDRVEALEELLSDPSLLHRLISLGDIVLGDAFEAELENGKRIQLPDETIAGLSLSELSKDGIGIYGQKGTGKSGMGLHIATSIMSNPNSKTLIGFDPKSLSYRGLHHFQNFYVLSWRKIQTNILLPPPPVTIEEWTPHVVNLFSAAGLKQGQGKLTNVIDELYVHVKNPTIVDLLDHLNKTISGKRYGVKKQWLESVIGIVERIVAGTGNFLFSQDNCQLEYLLDERSVVFEVADLLEEEEFVVSYLLTYIGVQNLKLGRVGGEFRKLILLEESQRSMGKDKGEHSSTGGSTAFARHVNELSREVGCPVVMLAQNYREIGRSYRSGATSIVFRSGEEDVKEMMFLGEYKRDVPHLPDRSFILRMNHRFTHPILCKTLDLPEELIRLYRDEEIARIMESRWEKLESLASRVSVSMSQPSPDTAKENEKSVPPKQDKQGREKEIEDDWKISSEERDCLLKYYDFFPDITITEFYNKLGVSAVTGGKRIKSLFLKAYIQEEIIESKGRGTHKVLVFSKKAEEFIEHVYGKKYKGKPRGGYVHYYYLIFWTCETIKVIYEVVYIKIGETSLLGNGGEIDIVWKDKAGKIHGVEVCLTIKNILSQEHVQKRLDVLDDLMILAKEADVPKIEKALRGMGDKLSVVSLKSFLEIKKSENKSQS